MEPIMQHPVRGFGVLLALVLLTACDATRISFGDEAGHRVPERWRPWLTTDHQTYVVGYTHNTVELTIGLRFENRSRQSVAIPRCAFAHSPVLDKLVFGEWVEVLTPVRQCWDLPIVVGPGRTVTHTWRISAGRPHTTIQPQFQTTRIPGTYRLRWELYEYDPLSQFHVGRLLPIEHRVSNEFRIIH
jgi:hypothetical protein